MTTTMFDMKTILITNDPHIASDAQKAGVSRVMVDLESHGKKERQASRATFISTHEKEDVSRMRDVLGATRLIVRINPWQGGSPDEIDHAIGEGADLVMLPMITSLRHVDAFLNHVGDRAIPLPLIETGYSMAQIGHIAARSEISEVYIGLNDLHLSLGLDFLFEPLGLGLVDWMAEKVKAHGKAFGFGGIATMHSGELPAERILGEHVRLGSSAVILSSRFGKDIQIDQHPGRAARIEAALISMREVYEGLKQREPAQEAEDTRRTNAIIQSLAEKARTRESF
jgi:2-keto-3-deoxy-L-rhamnonate aldolase RhmA